MWIRITAATLTGTPRHHMSRGGYIHIFRNFLNRETSIPVTEVFEDELKGVILEVFGQKKRMKVISRHHKCEWGCWSTRWIFSSLNKECKHFRISMNCYYIMKINHNFRLFAPSIIQSGYRVCTLCLELNSQCVSCNRGPAWSYEATEQGARQSNNYGLKPTRCKIAVLHAYM